MAKTSEKQSSAYRLGEPWPRFRDWFDTLVPPDSMWRGAFAHAPRIEEIAQDGHLTYRVEMPGINPAKDIDIFVSDGYLVIEGHREMSTKEPTRSEFFYGQLLRTLPLPSGTTSQDIEAQYADGILEITVATRSRARESVHIPIRRSLAGAKK